MTDNSYLLHLQPQTFKIIYILFLFLLFFIILFCLFDDTDSYELIGIRDSNDNNMVQVQVPYDKLNIFDGKVYIMYEYHKYYIEEITYGEYIIIDNVPVVKLLLKLNFEIDKEIIKFNVHYNKQRIIKKIINVVKEG